MCGLTVSTYSSCVGIAGCLFRSTVALKVIPGVGVKSTVATVVVGVAVDQVLFAAFGQTLCFNLWTLFNYQVLYMSTHSLHLILIPKCS